MFVDPFVKKTELDDESGYEKRNIFCGEGDWRTGTREKRGQNREAGDKGGINYATLRNISQSKSAKRLEPTKNRAGIGIEGYGEREF